MPNGNKRQAHAMIPGEVWYEKDRASTAPTYFVAEVNPNTFNNGGGMIESVPNKPKTPVSAFRIPLELKAAVQAKAKERGDDLTSIVIKAFEHYLRAK